MSYASMGQLLPRDFLERQPKRWQRFAQLLEQDGRVRKKKGPLGSMKPCKKVKRHKRHGPQRPVR